jgi:hypothetical protein
MMCNHSFFNNEHRHRDPYKAGVRTTCTNMPDVKTSVDVFTT